jgi:3-hydroxybutyryl-CoA dehydrogenase
MEISRIGVIGAGQMGAGIAQVAASSGFSCIVIDNSQESLHKAKLAVEKSLSKLLAKGLIKNIQEVQERIIWHTDLEKIKNCDLVIEAVSEQEDLKKNIFGLLDNILNKEAIIASNTSSISITKLASFTSRPKKFIGMHFMNPVPLMQLVEIILGHHTDEHTLNIINNLAEKMGKTTTVAKDYPGFIANRILMPMINEAFFALMEGVASASDIDTTMKLGCNQPMGPLALADFIGLDTCLAILEVLHKGLGDDKYRPCVLLRNYVQAGLLGRKTQRGVFNYEL